MFPTFDLGFTTLPAYFTLLMVAITSAILVTHAEWLRKRTDGNFMLDFGLLMMVCGLLGSRLLHVIADGHFMDYVNLCVDPAALEPLKLAASQLCSTDQQCLNAALGDHCLENGACGQYRDCLRVVKIWYGGYVFYGGLLLCIPSAIWFIRRRGVAIWSVGDVAGFGIPFGQFVGRLGCFFAGCCFGGPTEGPWLEIGPAGRARFAAGKIAFAGVVREIDGERRILARPAGCEGAERSFRVRIRGDALELTELAVNAEGDEGLERRLTLTR